MKILFVAVGKGHDVLYRDSIHEFTSRIQRYADVEWRFETASGKEGVGASLDEGVEILRIVKDTDFVVTLDERGKEFSTESLAKFLDTRMSDSSKRLIFVIGGAYGLSKQVIERANFVWSISKLTFPHQLVRLILSEQIYRACTVVRGEKYHHA